MITQLLERLVGSIHFYVFVGKNVAAEVIVEEHKHVIVDIKNPVLALELGVDAVLRKKETSETLIKIKQLGYSITVKYKGFEFDL